MSRGQSLDNITSGHVLAFVRACCHARVVPRWSMQLRPFSQPHGFGASSSETTDIRKPGGFRQQGVAHIRACYRAGVVPRWSMQLRRFSQPHGFGASSTETTDIRKFGSFHEHAASFGRRSWGGFEFEMPTVVMP